MTKTAQITNTAAETAANTDLFAVVLAHAEQYKDNGRGWDILLDMIADEALDQAEVLDVIGKTKSEFKAKNNVYKFLQPMVALRKADQGGAALAA